MWQLRNAAAVTLQRFVRGWLSRREQQQQQQQQQQQEQQLDWKLGPLQQQQQQLQQQQQQDWNLGPLQLQEQPQQQEQQQQQQQQAQAWELGPILQQSGGAAVAATAVAASSLGPLQPTLSFGRRSSSGGDGGGSSSIKATPLQAPPLGQLRVPVAVAAGSSGGVVGSPTGTTKLISAPAYLSPVKVPPGWGGVGGGGPDRDRGTAGGGAGGDWVDKAVAATATRLSPRQLQPDKAATAVPLSPRQLQPHAGVHAPPPAPAPAFSPPAPEQPEGPRRRPGRPSLPPTPPPPSSPSKTQQLLQPPPHTPRPAARREQSGQGYPPRIQNMNPKPPCLDPSRRIPPSPRPTATRGDPSGSGSGSGSGRPLTGARRATATGSSGSSGSRSHTPPPQAARTLGLARPTVTPSVGTRAPPSPAPQVGTIWEVLTLSLMNCSFTIEYYEYRFMITISIVISGTI